MHTAHTDSVTALTRGLPLLVLAGGFGTRLREVVSDVPKPLAPVDGRPYLEHMIVLWRANGLRRFVFLLHYQAELIIERLVQWQQDGPLQGCEVDWVIEPRPLGTGGAIVNAIRENSTVGDFLATNADTWLSDGFREIAAAESPAMVAVEVPDAGRYGSLDISDGQIRGFREKDSTITGSSWINSGLYKLSTGLFDGFKLEPFSLEQKVFPALVDRRALNVLCIEADFIDIGVPQEYARFTHWVTSGKTGRI